MQSDQGLYYSISGKQISSTYRNVFEIKILANRFVANQGRRRLCGRSAHDRTTFLAENGFCRPPFSADYDF